MAFRIGGIFKLIFIYKKNFLQAHQNNIPCVLSLVSILVSSSPAADACRGGMAQLPTEFLGQEVPGTKTESSKGAPLPRPRGAVCVWAGGSTGGSGVDTALRGGPLGPPTPNPTPTLAALIFSVPQNCAVALRVHSIYPGLCVGFYGRVLSERTRMESKKGDERLLKADTQSRSNP